MARNFEEAGSSGFLEGIVNYFPVIPSMQVRYSNSLKCVYSTLWSESILFSSFAQFFIFLIWLNFGRTAVNPFGTDEEDINVKLLLETHIQVLWDFRWYFSYYVLFYFFLCDKDSFRLANLYTQDLDQIFGIMVSKAIFLLNYCFLFN